MEPLGIKRRWGIERMPIGNDLLPSVRFLAAQVAAARSYQEQRTTKHQRDLAYTITFHHLPSPYCFCDSRLCETETGKRAESFYSRSFL